MNNRIILHIDFNSFFASVEQQANPFLRGKAIAIAGKGKHSIDVSKRARETGRVRVDQHNLHRTVITTASLEAKVRGVKTAMSSVEAKRVCPELIIIPGDPRKYSTVTKRFLDILQRHSCAVQQFSLDEAFADITLEAEDYFGATFIAQMIRNDIRDEIGEFCTASIGIASNKMLAKLAGESAKPNGITVVMPQDAVNFVDKQPLQAVCGIGKGIARRLGALGVTTTKALRSIPKDQLIREFKQYGNFLFEAARGLGDNYVNPEKIPPKSIGHSYTFATDLDTAVEIQTNLLAISDKVASRMRRKGFSANAVYVHVRYSNSEEDIHQPIQSQTKRKNVGGGIRVQSPVNDGLQLYKIAWSVLEKKLDIRKGIRLLGVSVGELVPKHTPMNLFDQKQKKSKVLTSLDSLHDRYGSGVWTRALTMNTEFKERVSGWHYDHEM